MKDDTHKSLEHSKTCTSIPEAFLSGSKQVRTPAEAHLYDIYPEESAGTLQKRGVNDSVLRRVLLDLQTTSDLRCHDS